MKIETETESYNGITTTRIKGTSITHCDTGPAVIEPGIEKWLKFGVFHREDGPAYISPSTEEWWYGGQLHRNGNEPAIIQKIYGRTINSWYRNGQYHRIDGPAIQEIAADGTILNEQWFYNGKPHRVYGPASTYGEHSKYWYIHGVLHRLDGPAEEADGGYKRWYISGYQFTEEQFNILVKALKVNQYTHPGAYFDYTPDMLIRLLMEADKSPAPVLEETPPLTVPVLQQQLAKLADKLDEKGRTNDADTLDDLIAELEGVAKAGVLPKLEPVPMPGFDLEKIKELAQIIEKENQKLKAKEFLAETDKVAEEHDKHLVDYVEEFAEQVATPPLPLIEISKDIGFGLVAPEPVKTIVKPEPETKSSFFPLLAAAGVLGAGFLLGRPKQQQAAVKIAEPARVAK